MSYLTDHQQKFTDLDYHLRNQDQLRRKANGGNSILFSYSPKDEQLYIQRAKELYSDKAEFIDISKLFVESIDEDGWDNFKAFYLDFINTPHKVFKSNDPEIDLYDRIIRAITQASENDRIPILVRTGCLYGTGIDNVNIMEHKDVMSMKHILVVFYPSLVDGNVLRFLNFKPASKYRCILVN